MIVVLWPVCLPSPIVVCLTYSQFIVLFVVQLPLLLPASPNSQEEALPPSQLAFFPLTQTLDGQGHYLVVPQFLTRLHTHLIPTPTLLVSVITDCDSPWTSIALLPDGLVWTPPHPWAYGWFGPAPTPTVPQTLYPDLGLVVCLLTGCAGRDHTGIIVLTLLPDASWLIVSVPCRTTGGGDVSG